MPIYDYRCTSCGFEKEYLQKVSDPLMTVCPQCHAETFVKKLTAAGFQLKGSGWYATDFRNSGNQKPSGGDAKADAKTDAKTDAKSDAGADGKSDAKADTKTDSGGGNAKPAAGSASASPASGGSAA
jgi:putative FmdB family regulatory protein